MCICFFKFFFFLLCLGALLIDQYCNPLGDVSFADIETQIEDILRKVKVYLSMKNSRHPSLSLQAGL